jgi:hypothetical protein
MFLFKVFLMDTAMKAAWAEDGTIIQINTIAPHV